MMDRQKIKIMSVAIKGIEEIEDTINDIKKKDEYEIPKYLLNDEDIRKAIIKALEKKLEKETKELEDFYNKNEIT